MAESALPKIAVVIPNYNHGYCIAHSLESVCTQDPLPSDVLVLDDCSTDNSVEVIASFVAKYPFVRLIRYPQKSVEWLKAWAEHIPLLQGDFVLSLGADDFIYPGYIRAVSEMVKQYPQCGVVFADWHLVDSNRNVVGTVSSSVAAPCFLEGQALVDQICKISVFESGVGTISRKELLMWLNANHGADLGPWNDSMGYPVMAMRQGACYIPDVLSASCDAPAPGRVKYAHRIFGNAQVALGYFQKVSQFFRSPAIAPYLPTEMVEALETKAMFCFDFEGRVPMLWQRLSKRARQLVQGQKFQQADDFLRRLVQFFPQQAEAHSDWGIVQFSLGRIGDAENSFRKAVELNPMLALAFSNLGVCLQARNALPEAAAAYQRAVQLDSTLANGFHNWGCVLFALGRYEEALPAFQRFIQLDPMSAAGHASIGHTQLALGRYAEAKAACHRALELDPNLAYAQITLEKIPH